MPARNAPLELVERVWIARGQVDPGHAVQERREFGNLGTGQEHRDHGAAAPDKLSHERGQLLVLPRACVRADDHGRRRDALDLLLQRPLPRKGRPQFAFVQPWPSGRAP